jgi:stage II sporulation protein D
MRRYLCLLALFLILIFCNSVYANSEVPEYIRVGLFYGRTTNNEVTLKSESGMKIFTRNGDKDTLVQEIKSDKEITLEKSSSSSDAVYISGVGKIGDGNNIVVIIPNENSDGIKLISVNDKLYRGEIEVRRFSDSDLTVINVLTMQEYLYGVVPREIGGESPEEALKAQAILARTYATKNYNKRIKWGYNVNPTTDDQAYGGYEWEREKSNKAVDDTDGTVVTYDGKLIGGYYFSTSGGYTENSENVWGGKVEYLEAVPDTYEPTNLKWSQWTVSLTADEIKQKLLEKYDLDLGDIKDIKPTKYSKVGRVIELKIIGTKGEEIITNESTRTYFGLYSQWFTVNSEPPKAIVVEEENEPDNEETQAQDKPLLKKLKDLLIQDEPLLSKVVEKRNTPASVNIPEGTFVFQGRGNGHAVGMSQNGAIGMANNNFTCEEIIKWYYKGVDIQK